MTVDEHTIIDICWERGDSLRDTRVALAKRGYKVNVEVIRLRFVDNCNRHLSKHANLENTESL